MGFLSKLFGKTERPQPLDRVPALARLLAAAADPRAMWPAFYASLRGHWDLRIDACRMVVTRYIAKQPKEQRDALVAALVMADPASWLPVRAEYHLDEMLTARGSGKKIANEKLYRQFLDLLGQDATKNLDTDPEDPAPCVQLATVARFGDDDRLAAQMYAEGTRRAPLCFAVHRGENFRLSARWGGSHDAQLAHARHVAATAPNGTLVAGLPITALFFHVSHLQHFDKNQKAALAFAPTVMGELREACARSVDDPQHQISASTFDQRTRALLTAMWGLDQELARREFAAINDVYIADMWQQMYEDPEPFFDMFRKQYVG